MRAARIAALKATIADLERHRVVGAAAADSTQSGRRSWTLGDDRLDGRLGGGLDGNAVHEIRPPAPMPGRAAAIDRAAAFAFALRLAVRRFASLDASSPPRAILYCTTPETRLDIGEIHAAGLAAAGLDPRRLLLVAAAGNTDALWAIEEGLKSEALALVIGGVDEIGLTPARRLSLAAAAHATPCLVLQGARSAVAPAVASRWRIGTAPSAPHAFDPAAPGASAWSVLIERALGGGGPPMPAPVTVEWSDEALRFRMASRMADRAVEPRRSGCRAAAHAAGARRG